MEDERCEKGEQSGGLEVQQDLECHEKLELEILELEIALERRREARAWRKQGRMEKLEELVGLVEDGITLSQPLTTRMSGAWPPPAPSVWKAWMVRPFMAASVCSTNPDSFNVSVWIITCTSIASATLRQVSIAAGVVPQSSCSFNAQAPAFICSSSGIGSAALPFPAKAKFIAKLSNVSFIHSCYFYE